MPGPIPFPEDGSDPFSRERRLSSDDRRQSSRRVDDAVDPLPELRALATTIRNCQRNGHPDLSKHLEALLTKLGA